MEPIIKHTIKENKTYFITMTVVNWVDVFTRKNHCDAIVESLRFCQKTKGLNIYAYCIMSNHIHMLVNVSEPFELKDVIRDFKKYTSKKFIFQIQNEPESRREWMLKQFEEEANQSQKHKTYKFWQVGNHAIEIYSLKFTWEKINYIHNNPVKAGLVTESYYWRYSSASNYQDMESVLEVEKISQMLLTF
jgi:putative transposase